MIYDVHMLANQPEYRIRQVFVPGEIPVYTEVLLEKIFYYGQNDFQDQLPEEHRHGHWCCSVSVGDVLELNGSYFLCDRIGWKKMTLVEFERYRKKIIVERSGPVVTP